MESPASIQFVVAEVSAIVSGMAGIQLGSRQSAMVENRLKTRMLKLSIKNFNDYLTYLKKNKESESQALLSLMTTHHTYFFREFTHFEYLLNRGLDDLIEKARGSASRTIKVWSAASSRGQEAYSLAMFFNFHLKALAPDVKFEIWGTDIDPESVQHAQNGVYRAEELKQSPVMYINDQWIRGTGNISDFSKVKGSLKQHCHFTTANLLKPDSFLSGKMFDVIFCRNVFIYFNQEQITSCTKQMIRHLEPEGILFLGVSESLNGLNIDVSSVGPSIYRHRSNVEKNSASKHPVTPLVAKTVRAAPTRPLEILCVDDSSTILALLKKILTTENGFTVKATAKNGLEAIEKLRQSSFDLVTLDLHMPEMDGIGFLTATKKSERPPVVIVSSINRDDTSVAKKALELGASDYVEKPSLANIEQAGNEIRSKLKMIWGMQSRTPTGASSSTSSPEKSSSKKTDSMSSPRSKAIKVLVVDDSQTIRQILKTIISQDPTMTVCAEAGKPSEVETLIKMHSPDVITLDIHMPEMDGVTLLKEIYPKYKIPTIMISSLGKEEGPQVLQALESGAIDYIQKPQMSQLEEAAKMIREKIKVAAAATPLLTAKANKVASTSMAKKIQSLIVLGASTGGTEALRIVLESLPATIPPIVIVQHIPPIFSAAFASRLNDLCEFEVREAKHGDEVKGNLVLIAPGGMQTGVISRNGKLFTTVLDEPPVNRHRPSVDYLFQSVSELKLNNLIAGIFTGMGADGAKMMKKLKDKGARTFAQNEETCVVFGMPKEAIAAGGVEFILPLEEIAQKLVDLSTTVKTHDKAA